MPSATTVRIRPAEETEIDCLATLWHQGYLDAHEHIVPAELTRARTLESFTRRMREALADVRVAGTVGAPLGFHLPRNDELYQLYVSREARGRGVARALISDAEACLVERGVELAWLSCAIGNDRAARFYEKSGWRRAGVVTYPLDAASSMASIDVWRYEKPLSANT